MTRDEALAKLGRTFHKYGITLYLGAGVSVDNGLPTWEQLVVSMYFDTLDRAGRERSAQPYPNYLFAIADWHLKQNRADPEVTARKVRLNYSEPPAFLDHLKKTLWAGFVNPETQGIEKPPLPRVLAGNPTLAAVARMCQSASKPGGVKSVITYNFDSLLEMALTRHRCSALWKAGMQCDPGKLPIYHVHGFVPIHSAGSKPEELVFTEEQFHQAALDPLSWLNMVQIQALTSTTCVMVGMSMNDRNLRRLLEAIRKLPSRRQHYAVLRRNPWPQLRPCDVEYVHEQAQAIRERFAGGGVQSPERLDSEVERIVAQVHREDWKQQTRVLQELGVEPIWYDKFSEVPLILDQISKTIEG